LGGLFFFVYIMYYLLGTRTRVQRELWRKENLNSKRPITKKISSPDPEKQSKTPRPSGMGQPHTCHIKQKRRHGEKVMKRPCPCTQPKDSSLLISFRRPQGPMESER